MRSATRLAMATLAGATLFFWRAGAPDVALAQTADRRIGRSPRELCSALQNTVIPREAIGLPTGGAVVVAASLVSATEAGNANGEFCKVLGSIHPVDPLAPPIRFQINLPTTWNNRSLQMGGGGFDGSVVTGLGGASNQVPTAPTPLAQGYVTLGSDSGHEGTGFDGTFALNAESLANFGHLQVKKTHDVGVHLTRLRYGMASRHSYFIGGSQGGHEALIAAQKYPADFDGVVSLYPAYNVTLLHLAANHFAKALYRTKESWINPNKVNTLVAAVYSACDGLDALEDGIIGDVAGCNRVFTIDAVRARLRCADGSDSGDSCLSDAQLAAVDAINSPFSLPFPVAGGLTTFPKWPVLDGATFLANTLGNSPTPSFPPAQGDAFQYRPSDATIRYIITRNLTLNTLTFDPNQWAARIVEVSTILDANSVDLTQFMSKGGKLILMVGAIDDSITPYNTLDYYNRLVTRFGQTTLDSFVRFYHIPGFGHGNGVFNAKFDALGALDVWVDRGNAPGTLSAVDANKGSNRSRPLCVYPAWPKYNGSGDVNIAASFRCVTPAAP
ncbi:MAG TPA: tannase/feruloyl esterase family alpha/beta hydrolase [Vicinamibacterales bacterium]|jgi:feruloyl esterase|nr:tannase/feruloyl esterase family alpha/beta hydrolase [Vicinamibacterales bacterium]